MSKFGVHVCTFYSPYTKSQLISGSTEGRGRNFSWAFLEARDAYRVERFDSELEKDMKSWAEEKE